MMNLNVICCNKTFCDKINIASLITIIEYLQNYEIWYDSENKNNEIKTKNYLRVK